MPALRKWTAAPVQQQAPMPAQQLACDLQRAQAGLECCRCSLPLERLHQPASQLVLLWCSGSAACCSAYACRLPQICSRQELASGLPENVCSRPELQCSACPAGPHSLLCGNSILEFQDSRRHLWPQPVALQRLLSSPKWTCRRQKQADPVLWSAAVHQPSSKFFLPQHQARVLVKPPNRPFARATVLSCCSCRVQVLPLAWARPAGPLCASRRCSMLQPSWLCLWAACCNWASLFWSCWALNAVLAGLLYAQHSMFSFVSGEASSHQS